MQSSGAVQWSVTVPILSTEHVDKHPGDPCRAFIHGEDAGLHDP
jgi:hypothetical protein